MSTIGHLSPAGLSKRPWAAVDVMHTKREGVKRHRTSASEGEPSKPASASKISEKYGSSASKSALNEGIPKTVDQALAAPSNLWSLSRNIAGQFTDLDPILTLDEQYVPIFYYIINCLS